MSKKIRPEKQFRRAARERMVSRVSMVGAKVLAGAGVASVLVGIAEKSSDLLLPIPYEMPLMTGAGGLALSGACIILSKAQYRNAEGNEDLIFYDRVDPEGAGADIAELHLLSEAFPDSD